MIDYFCEMISSAAILWTGGKYGYRLMIFRSVVCCSKIENLEFWTVSGLDTF